MSDELRVTADGAVRIDQLRPLIASGNRPQARKSLQSMLAALRGDSAHCRDVIDAMIEVLSADG